MTTPRPPAPLPRHVRALLVEYRDAHELPEAARDRIWSVVGAEEAPAPAFDPLEHEDSPRGASTRNARWLGWGMASLAAAAVLVVAWQLGGMLAERRQASRTPGSAVMQRDDGSTRGHASPPAGGHAAPRKAASASAEPPVVESPTAPSTQPATDVATSTEASRTSSNDAAAPTRARRPAPDADGPEPAPAEAGSTLAAERELVARAWRALALGETAQALDATAEHARRFPAGLLAPERAAIDTIARCRRGDADGPRRATAFHRAHPRSPLAERVDEACAAPSNRSTTP